MNNYYFKYEIKPINKSFGSTDGIFRMCIDRVFNDVTKNFEYKLVLIVARDAVTMGKKNKMIATQDDDVQQMLAPSFVDGYSKEADFLFISHNKSHLANVETVYQMSDGNQDLYYKDVSFVGVVSEEGTGIKQKHLFIKYVFNGLSEEDITGFGTFGFSERRDVDPKTLYRFNYYCIFRRKIDVYYTITKKRGSLVLEFDSLPEVTSEFEVSIAYSNKPIYKSNAFLPMRIKIPNGRKRFSVLLTDSDAKKDEYKYFRVVALKEPFNGMINFIQFRSESFNEKVYSENLIKGEKVCPFCFGPLKCVDNSLYTHSCTGTIVSKSQIKKNNKLLNGLRVCNSYDESNNKIKPFVIPPAIYNKGKKNIKVGILGVPDCGKSVYLSTLLGLQSGVNNDLSLINVYLNKFNKSLNFKMDNYFEYLDPTTLDAPNCIALDYKHQTFGDNLSDEDTMYQQFQMDGNFSTERTSTKSRFLPFILQSPTSNVIIRDIAGENATKEAKGAHSKESDSLLESDALIIFVSKKDTAFKDMINRLRGLKNKKVPVAVVLTKFDMVSDAEFDSSCSCNSDGTLDMINLSTYSGSVLQGNVNEASEEIRSYLIDNVPSFSVSTLETHCGNVKYFNVSALGDKTTTRFSFTGSKNGSEDIVYYNRPFRSELPLLWILYQNGIIG